MRTGPYLLPRRGGRAVECGGLENRLGRKLYVGSNPTPSAVKRAFQPSPIASAASQYHNAYHNQRPTTIKNLDARDARASRRRQRDRREAARVHRCGGGWPGWAQYAPRPFTAPVGRRVAAWGATGWGEWVERFADTGERARSWPTNTPAKVAKSQRPAARPLSDPSGASWAQLQRRWEGPRW